MQEGLPIAWWGPYVLCAGMLFSAFIMALLAMMVISGRISKLIERSQRAFGESLMQGVGEYVKATFGSPGDEPGIVHAEEEEEETEDVPDIMEEANRFRQTLIDAQNRSIRLKPGGLLEPDAEPGPVVTEEEKPDVA